MRPVYRSRRRRRRDSPSIPPSLSSPPLPLDLTTEIEQSVDAREKVEAAIGQFNFQRELAKPAFLLSLAREMQATGVDANRAQDVLAVWQAMETRAAQQREALRQLHALFEERVERFKSRSSGEALAALRRIIERLLAERDKLGADANAINKRIEKLLAEVEVLCPPDPAPPRESKDTRNPSQRSAKGKDKTHPGSEK
jgi:hypothetical protein